MKFALSEEYVFVYKSLVDMLMKNEIEERFENKQMNVKTFIEEGKLFVSLNLK